jgi:predicted phage tail protein
MMRLIRREPVMVTSLLKAVLVCAVAFGAPLTSDQETALIGVAGAILALGGVARQAVTPIYKGD